MTAVHNVSTLEGTLLIAALVIVAAIYVLVWAMCVAAGRADEHAEKIRRHRCENHKQD